MWTDEIVEDVRKAREEYAAKFNYNLEEIYEDLKRQQQMQSGRKIVSLPPREPETIPQET
jgi:polyhydroxyalkanoate synthesis regulator phasin